MQSYLDHHAASAERYLRFYAQQKSLSEAVTKAAMAELPSGQRFSHQWRIPPQVLGQGRDALLKLSFDDLRSFAALLEVVAKTLRPIRGIGLLTIYDTAHRIGAYLKLSPEFVYLHAGVRVGAKALGLGDWKTKLPMRVFPPAFQKLRPEQVEDCLCIYKAQLEQWAQTQRSKRGYERNRSF